MVMSKAVFSGLLVYEEFKRKMSRNLLNFKEFSCGFPLVRVDRRVRWQGEQFELGLTLDPHLETAPCEAECHRTARAQSVTTRQEI